MSTGAAGDTAAGLRLGRHPQKQPSEAAVGYRGKERGRHQRHEGRGKNREVKLLRSAIVLYRDALSSPCRIPFTVHLGHCRHACLYLSGRFFFLIFLSILSRLFFLHDFCMYVFVRMFILKFVCLCFCVYFVNMFVRLSACTVVCFVGLCCTVHSMLVFMLVRLYAWLSACMLDFCLFIGSYSCMFVYFFGRPAPSILWTFPALLESCCALPSLSGSRKSGCVHSAMSTTRARASLELTVVRAVPERVNPYVQHRYSYQGDS